MLDTNELPHLQPEPSPQTEEEQPPEEETLAKQIVSAFLCRKSLFYLGIVLCFIYFFSCFQGERLLRQGVYDMFEHLGKDGFGISYQAPSSYLDFKSGLNLDNLVITAPEKMGGWTFNAGRVSVSSTPFQPNKIVLEFNGTHSLKTKMIGDIRLVLGQGQIVVNLPDGETPFSITLFLKQMQAAAPKSMEGFLISESYLAVVQSPENKEKKEMSFILRSGSIRLPAYLRRYLSADVQELNLKGMLTGTSSDGAQSFLQNWQNGSGTVEVEQGKITWAPFAAQFSGTFGLDDSFGLMGAGTAKTYGFFALLDKFQEGDYLRSKRVSVAKVVLGEKLKTEKNEKIPSLSSAFSFQSGKIYMGQVLLYDKNER